MRTSIKFRQRNHEWKDVVVEKERAVCIGGERHLRMDFVDAGAEIESLQIAHDKIFASIQAL